MNEAQRAQLLSLADKFREECGPLCDCPCELDGSFDSPDSVYRAKHNETCAVMRFLQAAYAAGAADENEACAEIAENEGRIQTPTALAKTIRARQERS